MHHPKNTFLGKVVLLVMLSLLGGCVDPVDPEFRYQEGLVYIDALVGTIEGASYVSILESTEEFGINDNVFLSGAKVSFIKTDDQTQIDLLEEGELYLPPANFKAQIGDTWELKVELADGREYSSLPEKVSAPVPIQELVAAYEPELLFNEGLDEFTPGHSLSLTLEDPGEEENYYYWRFRSYEKLVNCVVCVNSIYRDGECRTNPSTISQIRKPYYTYACESDCWQIRYEDNINIFSDEFTNGTKISNLPVADIPLFTKRSILVELQQFSISASAYRYYKTLKDIVDNNSGFNAPLPAALVGNMSNPNNINEFVLGRFTAASTNVKTVFIDRTFVEGRPLETILPGQYEGEEEPVPRPIVIFAPCNEGRFSTGLRPTGWID
ncbi:DUF4249 domain-containing protein [Ulvibacterium sp.]|uniref:DUF4249 domain-containing protein n=1 Tax=Ulvibacterium sp. TaxID=2665914 RepID=UPI003BAA61FF